MWACMGMSPVTHRHFTGAKSKVQHLLKLAKIYLCSSKIMNRLKHRTLATHMLSKWVIFSMPFLSSMSTLCPSGMEASCVKFWVKLPHQRGIYSNRERVRDRYSEFSCQNMRGPPPVIQFCCGSLQVTNRNQGLLKLFSSFSFSILSLETPGYL